MNHFPTPAVFRATASLLLSMICCASSPSIKADPAYPLTIADARGKAVTIRSEPKRIVSLTPSNTEILFALGLGDRVVGVTNWCNYPPAAKRKPKIGDRNVSIEKVLSLHPDLILAHATLNDNAVRRLEGLNETILAFDPKTIANVEADILLIGRICNRRTAAERLVSRMKSQVARVAKSARNRKGLRALVVVQPNPLWAAGPKTFVDEMLSICHAENVAHDARPGFNTFPVERALARDPQLIVAGKEKERRFFLQSPVWRNTTAVRKSRVVAIDPDLLMRPGPRLADGLRILAGATHPPN